jgi:5'-methylthioadenosine phosphorylase
MVTDFDCWHPDHEHVTVEMIIGVLLANAERAKALVKAVVPRLAQRPAACPHGCDHALEHAIITAPEARDRAMVEKLGAIAGRVLKPGN